MEFGKGISCMEKKNIDWSNLGFAYMQTDKRYVSIYKDGQWDEGRLTEDATGDDQRVGGRAAICPDLL